MISQTVQNTQTHHERKLLKTYQFPWLRSVARLVKFSKQNYGCPRHTRPSCRVDRCSKSQIDLHCEIN